MKLYLLERIAAADYDETAGWVIRADNGRKARLIAANDDPVTEYTNYTEVPNPIWLRPNLSKLTCIASGSSVTGKPGIVPPRLPGRVSAVAEESPLHKWLDDKLAELRVPMDAQAQREERRACVADIIGSALGGLEYTLMFSDKPRVVRAIVPAHVMQGASRHTTTSLSSQKGSGSPSHEPGAIAW